MKPGVLLDGLIGPIIARRTEKLEKHLTKRVSEVDQRIKRLDKKLKKRARAARAAQAKRPKANPWTCNADRMATAHLSPFLEDEKFSVLYEEMVTNWFPGKRIEARWRAWLLTRFARQCQGLEGSFAEFGTYRAGYAFMILALSGVERFYLFDTFEGIPSDSLTDNEVERGMAGELADTSPEYVAQLLARWEGRFELVPGDVFETLPRIETGPLSFVPMDLNASAPTQVALEYAYPRLVRGGIMAFDDYGWNEYIDQRLLVEEFFSQQPDEVIALPTGQALMVKRP